MFISNFKAANVYGHINFNIAFKERLTFLTGLNGSGKTTVLRMMMGLLSPSFDTLAEIIFDSAELVVENNSSQITIRAESRGSKISIFFTDVEGSYDFDRTSMIIEDRADKNENVIQLSAEARTNAIVKAILDLPTPMFLGLDRRFVYDAADGEFSPDNEYQQIIIRRGLRSQRKVVPSLEDVQTIFRERLSELRKKQSSLDDELRKAILLDAFTYSPLKAKDVSSPPNKSVINSFRLKKAAIQKAVGSLGIPVDQVESRLTQFLDKLTQVVDEIEKFASEGGPDKGDQKSIDRVSSLIFEWMMNKSQVDRIKFLFDRIESYISHRERIYEPIDRFLKLTNEFLSQTGKSISVNDRDYLTVDIPRVRSKSLSALSSGERQIVVMLSHLSLNRRVDRGSVFIIDEPELSLHISWQEKFVDAILQANPKIQLVLATHSPAIVLGRDQSCVDVTEVDRNA